MMGQQSQLGNTSSANKCKKYSYSYKRPMIFDTKSLTVSKRVFHRHGENHVGGACARYQNDEFGERLGRRVVN
jgi:hypothetical protein